MKRTSSRRLVHLAVRVVALFGLAAAMMLGPSDGRARLDPYYFLRDQSFAQVAPRVLFVLDTSGSMVWRPDVNDPPCPGTQQRGGGTRCDRESNA